MSRCRIIEAGRYWAVSRRTTRRYHLFTPDERGEMESIFWYCLGHALEQCDGISLFAACLMSTHMHYVIQDKKQQAPLFFHHFHRSLALATKAYRGWPEEVFNKSETAAHELATREALKHSIAYTIVNPVAAFGVRYAHQWPGATVVSEDLGVREIEVTRPSHYFRGRMFKEQYRFRIEMPSLLQAHHNGHLEDAQKEIASEVRKLERAAWAEAKEKKAFFRGAHRIVKMKHTKRARSYEVFGARTPRFSARGNKEVARAMVAKIRRFRFKYEAQMALVRAGRFTEAIFPYGTWKMRVLFGARVEPPPEVLA